MIMLIEKVLTYLKETIYITFYGVWMILDHQIIMWLMELVIHL